MWKQDANVTTEERLVLRRNAAARKDGLLKDLLPRLWSRQSHLSVGTTYGWLYRKCRKTVRRRDFYVGTTTATTSGRYWWVGGGKTI